MNNKQIWALALAAAIIFAGIAGLLGYFIYQAKSQGILCQNNPFTYGAQKAQEVTGSALMCSCSFLDGSHLPFTYDNNSVKAQFQNDVRTSNMNFSEILKGLSLNSS